MCWIEKSFLKTSPIQVSLKVVAISVDSQHRSSPCFCIYVSEKNCKEIFVNWFVSLLFSALIRRATIACKQKLC